MVVSDTPVETKYIRDFVFTFNNGKNGKQNLRLKLNINAPQNVEELASRVVQHHKIPCFVEGDLKNALREFVESEKLKLSDETFESLIKKFRENPSSASEYVKTVATKYKKTWSDFAKTEASHDNIEDFSSMYHKLIHSRAMNMLLSLEENYYFAVQKVVRDEEHSMVKLQERQELEMQRACEHVIGSLYTENDVNNLAAKHDQDNKRLLGEWKSKHSKLMQNQKREYRQIVSRLNAEMVANNGEVDELGHTYIEVKKITELSKTTDTFTMLSTENTAPKDAPTGKRFQKGQQQTNFDQISTNSGDSGLQQSFTPHLEESFTINLGAQMKTMHNIRLVAAPTLHFCRHSNLSGDVLAQRLQTVLSLYSNSLSGIVLLDDSTKDSRKKLREEFAAVCDASTEFHFSTFQEQLHEIKRRKKAASDQASIKSEDTLSMDSTSSEKSTSDGDFQDGDFYVTKHSNLSKVHIVFHLSANISNMSSSSTVSSRHSVILGLRHILKVMSSHDVANLTLPILLCHELPNNADDSWIIKRAELVMKCMKGFMMEMATWDGGISRTMQFVVPPGIGENTFYRLSTMLPEIFRTTSARNLTTATPKKVAAPGSPKPGSRR